MKYARLAALLLALLLFTSCGAPAPAETTPAPQTIPAEETETKEKVYAVELDGTLVCPEIFSAEEGRTVSLPDVSSTSLLVVEKVKIAAEGTKEDRFAYILGDFHRGGETHTTYLATELKEGVLVCNLKAQSSRDLLYAADVDGDGVDEILTHQTVSENGKKKFLSRVFRVGEKEYKEIFNSRKDLATGEEKLFDSGYTSEFGNRKKLIVTNPATKYRATVDISGIYADHFFDNAGKAVTSKSISCGEIYEISPKNAVRDTAMELEIKQTVTLLGEADVLGVATTVLKYDKASDALRVYSANFALNK